MPRSILYGPAGEVLSNIHSPYTDVNQDTAIMDESKMPAARYGKYGEQFVRNALDAAFSLNHEGGLVKAGTFPGTSIAGTAARATFVETDVLALLRNTSGAAGKNIMPLYLRLLCTGAPTGSTALHLALSMEDADRFSAGGSQLGVAANTYQGLTRSDALATAAVGRMDFGAVTTTANGANRKFFGRKLLKNAIPVVGDEFIIIFGNVDDAVQQLLTGAAAQVFTTLVAPVTVVAAAATHSLLFHLWSPAQTVSATWEVEAAWIAR